MTTKQVAITGAGRGIGRSIAETFLRHGWVVWALMRQEAQIDALTKIGDARFVSFDAGDEASVTMAAKRLQRETINALVNNAGVAMSSPLAKTSTEDFRRVQQINVITPFVLCRELMPLMAKNGGGRVINIASTASKKGFKYTSAYCASKHALLGMTRALAVEFAAKQVTVNAVSPGWTETDMFASTIERIASATGRSPGDARAALERMNPLGRAVLPDEVADVVYFLASSTAGAAITGASYDIDGGETV